MITGKTGVVAIIGHPVEHSLSPVLHNPCFRDAGLDLVYTAFDVEDTRGAVAGVRALGIRGLSVTIPHKSAIIPLLDKVDPAAAAIGAVNTVVNRDGVLHGFNTDRDGILFALEEKRVDVRGKPVLILGAGGAARAAAFAIAEAYPDSPVLIAARRLEQAISLASDLNRYSRGQSRGILLNGDAFAATANSAALVINATSLGMKGEGCPFPEDLFRGDCVYFDIVYTPVETPFILSARFAGAVTVTGDRMFLRQAAAQFQFWTGKKPSLELMEKVLSDAIR